MGFLNRAGRDAGSARGVSTIGLVVEATAPPEGAPPFGSGSHGTVRILADAGSGPATSTMKFRFSDAHWLVPGMEIAVTIDPAQPGRFELDWGTIPAMKDRVAANDPTLADPLGARLKVSKALGLDPGSAKSDHFNAAMAEAARTRAPDGKLRAVILVATIRGRTVQEPHEKTTVTQEQNSAAVLAVNIPGRTPYAVFKRKFKYPRLQRDLTGAGLPALVSAGDPNDVEILWDEVGSVESQLATRISDSSRDADQRTSQLGAMGQQITDAVERAGTDAPAAVPAPGAAALEGLAPEMRQMAADNAKRTLQFVQDPAQRRMLVEQYRAAGIILDEGDEPPERA
jgi:hypothetical protein